MERKENKEIFSVIFFPLGFLCPRLTSSLPL